MISTHGRFDSRTLDRRCRRGHECRLRRGWSRRLEVDHCWTGGGGCRGTGRGGGGGYNRLIIMTTRFHADSAAAAVGIVAFDNVWQRAVGCEK
ncbi:hypothetical protein T4E_7567 [Trichinella pseudospiralis]|uniref:Uncharacterized protein n=1 Tax=Trichinella pseudospiralis TaxID=6337 RepID=A0A0V0Y3A8_TRIPS|nr:hypothetical protein T4E_7567 [Trichinella pseudospiralis]